MEKKMVPYAKGGETKLVNEANEVVVKAVLEAGFVPADQKAAKAEPKAAKAEPKAAK